MSGSAPINTSDRPIYSVLPFWVAWFIHWEIAEMRSLFQGWIQCTSEHSFFVFVKKQIVKIYFVVLCLDSERAFSWSRRPPPYKIVLNEICSSYHMLLRLVDSSRLEPLQKSLLHQYALLFNSMNSLTTLTLATYCSRWAKRY